MLKLDKRILVLAFAGVVLAGCGIGNAPSGASDADMKATVDKLPPDDAAKLILDSPGPMDQSKRDRVKAIYDKAGKEIPNDIQQRLNAGGGQGAPKMIGGPATAPASK